MFKYPPIGLASQGAETAIAYLGRGRSLKTYLKILCASGKA
ncbi:MULTISPECIES: hypothetical protein [Nostoc]|nr:MULTISPECIES: hypothetical protein [Nostoc]